MASAAPFVTGNGGLPCCSGLARILLIFEPKFPLEAKGANY